MLAFMFPRSLSVIAAVKDTWKQRLDAIGLQSALDMHLHANYGRPSSLLG
jgi:hypothetical protein